MTQPILALFNLGGGEIVLICALMLAIVFVVSVIVGLLVLMVALTRKASRQNHTPAQRATIPAAVLL